MLIKGIIFDTEGKNTCALHQQEWCDNSELSTTIEIDFNTINEFLVAAFFVLFSFSLPLEASRFPAQFLLGGVRNVPFRLYKIHSGAILRN